MYSPMPRIPTTRARIEDEFVPDLEPAEDALKLRKSPFYIARLSIYEDDEELDRKEIREIGRRSGVHEGRKGWWIEKEWEVKSITRFKRLFNFG